eukprot:scaffold82036_cov82-Cyclotella_meneghiniana.AAC.3
MEPQAQEIGYCQNHGIGASQYNSIEVIGCSDTCLCFRQVASPESDVDCDTSRAIGWNVKMSCFNKCLVDCNGSNCGETATTSRTRLMLTGSGPICASPVSEEDFSCETTGMILDDEGNVIDLLLATNGNEVDTDAELPVADIAVDLDAVDESASEQAASSGEASRMSLLYCIGFWHAVNGAFVLLTT